MPYRLRLTCERIRPNNGIVEGFFTGENGQQQSVLVNILPLPNEPLQLGHEYIVTIEAIGEKGTTNH